MKRLKTVIYAVVLMSVFVFCYTLIEDYHVRHKGSQKSLKKKTSTEIPIIRNRLHDENSHNDDSSVASKMYNDVTVLCWIMTSPKNLLAKAGAVKETWGKRCNKLLFFSSVTNTSFPAVGLNVSEGRQHLTAKSMKAFQYIYDHHLNDADWFLKADDDTYVIMENLRYFLSTKNTSDPVYYGHFFKKPGFHSGGAGYVLSKESLTRFGTRGDNSTICREDGGKEDIEIAKCLKRLNVQPLDGIDKLGRSLFHVTTPGIHLSGRLPYWYYVLGHSRKIYQAPSDYAISFHYINPEKMLEMEYFIYHLRPYGIKSGFQDLNQ